MLRTIIVTLTLLSVLPAPQTAIGDGIPAPEAVEPIKKVKTVDYPTLEPKAVLEAPVVVKTQSANEASVQPRIVDRLYAIGGQPLVNLIEKESGFNPNAVNPSSGACGLFQRLPCNVPLGDAEAQIKDGTAYILSRYGSYQSAWNFWLSNGWY